MGSIQLRPNLGGPLRLGLEAGLSTDGRRVCAPNVGIQEPVSSPPSGFAAGLPALADICSLIYLRFWECGRGARLRQLGVG